MRRYTSFLSILISLLMLWSVFAACSPQDGGKTDGTSSGSAEGTSAQETEGNGTDAAPETDGAQSETDGETEGDTDGETEGDTDGDTDSETDLETDPETETDEDEPALNIDDAAIIEGASSLSNGVNAYFEDGSRKNFITENQNMSLSYSTDMLSPRTVSYIKNKNGNSYVENTMDVFVKMKSGGTYYASGSKNSAKVSQFAGLNIFRFGYYYYDVHFEDQNFINEINVNDSLTLDISDIASSEGVKARYNSSGLTCQFLGNSVDPQVVFSNVSFDTADYNYLEITMKADIPATLETDCQIFIRTSENSSYRNVSFDVVSDGEYHTYYVYLGNIANYSGTLTDLRLDFSMSYSTAGGSVEIKEIKALDADVAGAPQDLGFTRILHTYSDKLHQELRFAAVNTVNDVAEVGMITHISADTVDKLIVKDASGTHSSLEDADQNNVEYIAFDIKDAGIFGYVLPCGSTDSLRVSLDGGVYSIIQSASPEDGMIESSPKGSENANDFRMGQRIYTDESHSFDAFLREAELERAPLGEKNFAVSSDSSSAEFEGYDPLRGCYTFTMAGTTFSPAYFEYPNKHFKLSFNLRGDEYDRQIYVMATTAPYGHLEGAVLLDSKGLLLPVPVQVSKNFKGDGEANLYNIDDTAYGESILPVYAPAGEKLGYTLLNLYQNWGTYPLKQLSSVQYFVPYYHLSTGVTETNCLKPWYYTSIARDHWNLPDHRAMSAPFWHEMPGHSGGSQPQHTLGGAHYFLEYTNSDGEKIITENVKNTVVSSGPTYAEVISDYVSDDGKIKVSYTHTELPQTDENRTYYQIRYEVLEDLTVNNFKTDFSFYAVMDQIGKMGYTQIGYLDENNESRVVSVSGTNADKYYTLGDECPYISYFNNPNSSDYVNVSFLICNSEFIIGGERCDAPFVLVDRGNDDMKKIALTLDLGEVTLTAGDSFYINAILMPWGSHLSDYSGDAPDKNVRDVRENSLLDPFRGEAVANCETVESVFIPQFRSTDGVSAEFRISGGENNVAVRVYGFEKLTAPKIYELVGGEWKEYTVSSKDTPDNNGFRHYYDGYSVFYDGDGTFSYSFVTTMTEGAERVFRIVADTDFEGWPKEETGNTDGINVYKTPEQLHTAASTKVFFELCELMEDDTYLRLAPKETASEAYFTAYTGEGETTGQYLVFKYRLPSTNVLKKDTVEIFASTKNTAETGGDNFNVVLSTDGEWHVAIIDLSLASISNGFEAEPDGSYSVKYVRLDPFNGKTPSTEAFDIAYLAVIDSLEKITLFNESVEYATLYEGNKRTGVDTSSGETVDSNVSYIHPDSGYKSSSLAYATHLDMINGKGGTSASYSKRGGNSVSGIDTFDINSTTINGSNVVFSGWTVVEGGIEKYVWSVDGLVWHDAEIYNRALGNASSNHLNLASSWFLSGYTFSDTEGSLSNAVYQSQTGQGDNTAGLVADLSDYVGQTVDVIFAAVPKSDTSSLCLIAHAKGIEVLEPKDVPVIPEYNTSSLAYASHLDMINGAAGEAASYSMRGGNSTRGVDVFEYNGETMCGSLLVFSGWTVAEGGIEKYVWSVDGENWFDAVPHLRQLGSAGSNYLSVASNSFLGGYTFSDTTASLVNAIYQSQAGQSENTAGLAADLSAFAGETVNVSFAAVPKGEPDKLCPIAFVTGVEVLAAEQ